MRIVTFDDLAKPKVYSREYILWGENVRSFFL